MNVHVYRRRGRNLQIIFVGMNKEWSEIKVQGWIKLEMREKTVESTSISSSLGQLNFLYKMYQVFLFVLQIVSLNAKVWMASCHVAPRSPEELLLWPHGPHRVQLLTMRTTKRISCFRNFRKPLFPSSVLQVGFWQSVVNTYWN